MLKRICLPICIFIFSNVQAQQWNAPCRDEDEIHIRWMRLLHLIDPCRQRDPFTDKRLIKLYMPPEDHPDFGQFVKLGLEVEFNGDSMRQRVGMRTLNQDLLKIIKADLYVEDLHAITGVDIRFYREGKRRIRFKNSIWWHDTIPNLQDSFAMPLRLMPFHSTFKDSGNVVIFAFWPIEGMQYYRLDPEYYLNQAAETIKRVTMRKNPRPMRLYYFDDSTRIVIEPSKDWTGWYIPAHSLKPENYRPVFWDIPYLGKQD
jgi:hypothetical protein